MTRKIRFLIYATVLVFVILNFSLTKQLFAQKPKQLNAAEIELALKKLNVLGSVLYIAAHPDDENTRLISYFANEKLYRTAYLSLTRGDGGQNLVGPDLREKLGVIRTQELLAARRIDGGKQYFTRANDFGYSKTQEETIEIWNEEEVLSDMVWVIRSFKPDIIITRFQGGSRKTHGHHTASATLAKKAYKLAADKKSYPDHLKLVDTWQAKRILFNTSWWFYGSREKFKEADKSNMVSVDVGKYNTLLGESYGEIAAKSRSMHKSQGFGATGTRGSNLEYMELIDGANVYGDAMDGVGKNWGRVKGSSKVKELLEKAFYVYDGTLPHNTVKILIEARKELQNIKDAHWKKIKTQEIDEIIQSCLGLYLKANSKNYKQFSGDSIEITFEAVNRSPLKVSVKKIQLPFCNIDTLVNWDLIDNENQSNIHKVQLPVNMTYSIPYWLREDHSLGMYTVNEQELIGTPENIPALPIIFTLDIEGTEIKYKSQVINSTNDPVKGEVIKSCIIVPELLVELDKSTYLLTNNEPKSVKVKLSAFTNENQGRLELSTPRGWRKEPSHHEFTLNTNDEKYFEFKLYPPLNSYNGSISAVANVNGKIYSDNLSLIEYDHIPTQMLLDKANSKLIKTNLVTKGKNIGYIMGAGDKIPESLELIGYKVDLLTEADIRSDNLINYDAIITGIRAYNTNDYLKTKNNILLEYVKQGGTMLVQYNTRHRMKLEQFAPYPIKLSRDRVTEEDAVVDIINETHRALNFPNKITAKDFNGWVQERGLYFPGEWDDNYESLISCHDKGEEAKTGSILITKYGEGHYIYSGISWFRQLPAGVPGAYRLFTNLVSIGKE